MKLDEISYKPMNYLNLRIHTSKNLSGTKVVDFLLVAFDLEPQITPSRFGTYGRIRTKYTQEKLTEYANNPNINSHLILHGPKNAFMLHRGCGDDYEYWIFDFDLTQIPTEVVLRAANYFLQLPTHLATLHALSLQEVEYCMKFGLVGERVDGWSFKGIGGPQISGLPILTWRTYFGPMYIRHFGKERLLSSPAYSVKEVHPDVISIQLTKDFRDIDQNWDMFHGTRQKVIAHLGADSFQKPGVGERPEYLDEGQPYIIPASSVPEELVPLRRKSDERMELLRIQSQPHEPINSITEILANPKRFRVVTKRVEKDRVERMVIDDYRKEFIRFPDAECRISVAEKLLSGGAEFQDFAKYMEWGKRSKSEMPIDGPMTPAGEQNFNTNLLE